MFSAHLRNFRSLSSAALLCMAASSHAQEQRIQSSCTVQVPDPATSTGIMVDVEPGSPGCRFAERTGSQHLELVKHRIQIEGFQPGDHLTHVYGLTLFGDSGVANSSFFPDETGYAEVEMSKRAGARQDRNDQLIVSSMQVETKEMFFTLDLVDVSLDALVNALLNAIRNRELNVGILEGRRPDHSATLSPDRAQTYMRNTLVANGRRLSLRATNVTLEEALDLIYQQTGCSVFEQQGWLVIQLCG